MKKSLSITLGIAICLWVGFLSRLLHETAMEVWYPFLEKSALNPPDIVFPIVWGVIYVLMGVSLGLLISAKDYPSRVALLWMFAIQLALNIVWNYFFFFLQDPLLGLVTLIALDMMAVIFFISTLKSKQGIALFFFPYLIWMIFAAYLNLYIYVTN